MTEPIQIVLIRLLIQIEPFYIVLVVVVGLIGNTISFGIFLFTKLHHKHSNFILSALALCDNGFLITLFFANINIFNYDLFNTFDIVCKFTVYFTYIFSFLSVWYVILFSIERYIVVQFPLKKYDICNQSRNKLSVAFFFIFSLLFYSFSYFSSHVHEYENQKRCVIKEKWHKIVQFMTIIDVFVTILIPFVVILFTNISIYFKLMKNLNLENGFERKRKNEEFSTDASFLGAKINDKIEANDFVAKNSILLSSRRKTVSIIRENYLKPQIELKRQISYPELSSFNEKNELKIPTQKKTNFTFFRKFSALTSLLRRSAELKRAKMYSRTTRMLIIISITFILLNSPMAISRIHSVLLSSIESHSNHSLTTNSSNHSSNNTSTGYTIKELNHHLMQRISGYFYYLNFSVNFFLYVLNGSQFREILFKFTHRKKSRGTVV